MRCYQSLGFKEVESDKSCGRIKRWAAAPQAVAGQERLAGLKSLGPHLQGARFLSSQHTLLVGDIPSKGSAEISS